MNTEAKKILADYSKEFVLFPGQHPTAHIDHLLMWLHEHGWELKKVDNGNVASGAG